jgi:SAM-dependent methyltransferase
MDASYIATTGIPKLISKRSTKSTTAPFLKAINDIAGITLFSRETDEVWADLKKELRTCVQNPTFTMLDQSTDQFDVPIDKLSDRYKDDNGYEIFNRTITRIMMIDITGIEMTAESFEHCYDTYFKPQREHVIDIVSNMKHLDDKYALQLFKNTREMYKYCTKLRTNGWVVRLILKKHDISINNIGDLNKLLDYANEYVDIELIQTINEATLMFMLAVPTTASLSSRCVHYMNYIRDTEPEIYSGLLDSAREFYKTYKNKDETLKKPIKGDAWVDFILNVLYWWTPTMVSVKLVRETVDVYQPGDILIMSLNCDRDAPAPENTQARYTYMTEHPHAKAGEALWQDERVCAGAYFAQNEAAFILAKLYSNYAVSIGEGIHKSYMVSRVDYHMCLHELDLNVSEEVEIINIVEP